MTLIRKINKAQMINISIFIFYKKTLLLFMLIFNVLCFNSLSQTNSFILAGDSISDGLCSILYQNPNDTTLQATGWIEQKYYIDLNNDGVDDYYISSYAGSSPGGSICSSYIYPANSNCFILKNNITSNYADTLNINDTIDNNNLWESNSGMLAYYAFHIPSTFSYAGLWGNIANKYIGLKIVTNNDTLFGWCKITVEGYCIITIYEFAIKNCNGSGIEQIQTENYLLFPNPATKQVSINFSENDITNITIYNIFGREVYNCNLQNNKGVNNEIIDVSDWIKGMYIVEIRTQERIKTGKLLVE